MSKETESRKESSSIGHKMGTVIGVILCVVLLSILVINITLIIRSFINPDKVPSVGRIIFQVCDALIINKIDVMPYFDLEKVITYAHMRNPGIKIFPSA